MQSLRRRIEHLEHRTGAGTQQGLLLVVMPAGAEFALDFDKCADILAERGLARPGRGVSLLDLSDIPQGLNTTDCNPSAGQRSFVAKADR